MVAKKTKAGQGGGAIGDFAAGVGTFLGKAERKWRDWGPREAIEQAVADVRDRAAALLKEVNAARTATSTEPAEPPPVPKPKARRVAKKAPRKAATKATKGAAKKSAASKARR